jgi:hypothetical protein
MHASLRVKLPLIGMSAHVATAQIDRFGVRRGPWSCTRSAAPNGGYSRECLLILSCQR